MYRSILVPLDGSPFAEHALPLALAIARRSGAAVELVHAHTAFAFADSGLAYDASLDMHLREQEKGYMDGVARRVKAAAAAAVGAAMLDAPIADAIDERAAAVKADL